MTRFSAGRGFVHLVIAWLVLAVVFAFVASQLFRKPYDRLVSNGQITEGWITKKEPENHQNVHYAYSVNSQTYSGIGHGGQGGLPAFENLQVGQKVPVVYDKTDPQVSSLGDPAERLRSGNALTVVAAILFPTFIIAAMLFKGVLRVSRDELKP